MLLDDVVLCAARLAGPAGRRGGTVGTLLCRDLECWHDVRVLPPLAHLGLDRDAARAERVRVLRQRSRSSVGTVLAGGGEG